MGTLLRTVIRAGTYSVIRRLGLAKTIAVGVVALVSLWLFTGDAMAEPPQTWGDGTFECTRIAETTVECTGTAPSGDYTRILGWVTQADPPGTGYPASFENCTADEEEFWGAPIRCVDIEGDDSFVITFAGIPNDGSYYVGLDAVGGTYSGGSYANELGSGDAYYLDEWVAPASPSEVALTHGDRNRLDLIWWGVWAVVGLQLTLLIAPRLTSLLDPTRGL